MKPISLKPGDYVQGLYDTGEEFCARVIHVSGEQMAVEIIYGRDDGTLQILEREDIKQV